MRYLFLDIDGVLNSVKYYESDFIQENKLYKADYTTRSDAKNWDISRILHLDAEAIKLLNSIVRDDINIIVSSVWRILNPLPKIQFYMEQKGFIGTLCGVTPRLNKSGICRGCEVASYIYSKLDLYNYDNCKIAILDDDSDMGCLASCLVQTSSEYGLEIKHIEQIKQLLKL